MGADEAGLEAAWARGRAGVLRTVACGAKSPRSLFFVREELLGHCHTGQLRIVQGCFCAPVGRAEWLHPELCGPRGFFMFTLRPFAEVCRPCSGARALSRYADPQQPGFLLSLLIPQLPYHLLTAPASFPGRMSQIDPLLLPLGHRLTSGSCELWPGLTGCPVRDPCFHPRPLVLSKPALSTLFHATAHLEVRWCLCRTRGRCSWLLEASF